MKEHAMLYYEIDQQLARGNRPGYGGERGRQVSRAEVDAWITEAQALGIQSIICLLADDQLRLYGSLPTDLIAYYRQAGFAVAHVPAQDYQPIPLSREALSAVWDAYQSLPKPTLVHCSAGMDRTGAAVQYITQQLRQRQ
jgi:protein tyrosine phosphatase (PTP) superfamily phosphohydrolase (DUF442 family)